MPSSSMAFTGFSLASRELMMALTLLLKQLVSWPQFKQWFSLPLPSCSSSSLALCLQLESLELSVDYGGWTSLVDIEKLIKATRTIHVTL